MTILKKKIEQLFQTIFFGNDNHSQILQDDNDPKHTSGKAQKQRKDNQVKRISWLAQSPDLNPMKNAQSVLKVNIGNYKPSLTKELKRIIMKEQKKFDKIFAENLVSSMKKRICDVIFNKSDHIVFQFISI